MNKLHFCTQGFLPTLYTGILGKRGGFRLMSTEILSDRICLITGSSRGIGLGVARVFAENGASVILHGRDENVLRQSLAELV